MDETLSVPKDTKIKRGPVTIYRYRPHSNLVEYPLDERYVSIDDDATVWDLIRAETATERQIRDALNFEAPVKAEPAPAPAPTYARIAREDALGSSYLSFGVGTGEQRVRTAPGWTVVGFNLPMPHVVGRLETSLEFRPLSSDRLEVKLFDSTGVCHLHVPRMTKSSIEFDHVKLMASDYMLGFRPCGGALEGLGSYHCSHSTLVGELPGTTAH